MSQLVSVVTKCVECIRNYL